MYRIESIKIDSVHKNQMEVSNREKSTLTRSRSKKDTENWVNRIDKNWLCTQESDGSIESRKIESVHKNQTRKWHRKLIESNREKLTLYTRIRWKYRIEKNRLSLEPDPKKTHKTSWTIEVSNGEKMTVHENILFYFGYSPDRFGRRQKSDRGPSASELQALAPPPKRRCRCYSSSKVLLLG